MKTYIIMILSILFLGQYAICQNQNAGILTNSAYLENPVGYLSTVNQDLMTTDVLIDRSFYNDLILNCNGVDKVTVIKSSGWAKIQMSLKNSSNDPTTIPSTRETQEIINVYRKNGHVMPIGLIDMAFDKLNPLALQNGSMVEGDEFLEVRSGNSNFLVQDRVIAASSLGYNVTGDEIIFVLSSKLFFTNNEHKLESVEIDFGNGEGFKKVVVNQHVKIQYQSSRSEFVEIITKLNYMEDGDIKSYYAHSSLHRTGSSVVPGTAVNSSRDAPTTTTRYYPEGCQNVIDPESGEIFFDDFNCYFNYNILFATEDEGKLRRPIIITDGFDPGNNRDYYKNIINYDESDGLPFNNDTRGLYQLLNGDPSPWETEPTADLVVSLRNEGYDIVFVNYIQGAGDIPTNANRLVDFFDDVINGPDLRDNKTEENILVGPSMGGVITRLMLTTMESENKEHYVKSWLAFDSPMQGANVPITLQHALDFLTNVFPFPSAIANLGSQSTGAISSLETPAAKQLLRYHFSATSGAVVGRADAHQDFNTLYSMVGALGYPSFSKRYSISCGGESTLYNVSPSGTDLSKNILKLRLLPWLYVKGWANTNTNSDTDYALFEGSRLGWGNDEERRTHHQLGMDNAPGGYITPLYTFNCTPSNDWEADSGEVKKTKSTFMPTCSVLGLPLTTENMYRTWNEIDLTETPFDDFFGQAENEEHVNVSRNTAIRMIRDFLHPDFYHSNRPFRRAGQNLDQVVSGPVAYTFKHSVTFGGDGNTFTFEEGADIRITVSDHIKFEPGFLAANGSAVCTSIEPVEYESVFRNQLSRTNAIDFTKLSTFLGDVYDYSRDESNQNVVVSKINIFPNPVSKTLSIEFFEDGDYDLEIYNSLGILVESIQINETKVFHLDISNYMKGYYTVKIKKEAQVFEEKKFIKI